MPRTKAEPKRSPTPVHAPDSGGFTSVHGADVDAYIREVLGGKVNAGRNEIAAVRRHVEDLKRSAGQWRYQFCQAEADRAIRFVESLQHSTGEFYGKPFLLLPWQKFLIWSVIGWRDKRTNYRRFRKVFYSVGRGNGKSPLAAAVLLFLSTADNPPEPRAELKIAATQLGKDDDSGAMIVFNECCRMIQRQPTLRQRCRQFVRSILYTPTNSTIQPLGKEAKNKDGFVLHGYVADELHEWHEEHRGVWSKLQTAMGKRRQPLGLIITTAGSDRSIIWREEHRDACKVVNGVYEDDTLFVLIFQYDVEEGELPAADPFDPANFRQSNPNLGVSVQLDYLESFRRKAKNNPAHKNDWLRYHCNIMVRSQLKLIDPISWAASAEELPSLEATDAHGGIDLGWRDDLTSFYLCFLLSDGRYALKGFNWICEDTGARDLHAEPFASWVRSGHLRVTPGNTFDPGAMYLEVKRAQRLYHLHTVAMDPNNARAVEVHLVNQMKIETYSFGQNCRKYNEPLRTFLQHLTDGKIVHDGDPVLSWAADNLVANSDAGGLMMPDKRHSDEKIDPIVAALMAFSECLYGERKPPGYNKRGLRSLRPRTAKQNKRGKR